MDDRTVDVERYEAVSAGYDERLFAAAAIGAGDRVLDVGCGYGRTTLRAARAAPGGHVLGNDLSEELLREARGLAAAEGVDNVEFEQGDAQVHGFEVGGFDVVVSRFGTMFFADPAAAFANIGRALRSGGRLALTVTAHPRDNDLTQVLGAVLSAHAPPMDDVGGPGLSSLADPDRVREVLAGAGFRAVSVTALETGIDAGPDADAAAEFVLGWSAARGALPLDDHAAMAEVRRALVAAFGRYQGPDGVQLRSSGWLVTAERS